jgi:hypothetical protein
MVGAGDRRNAVLFEPWEEVAGANGAVEEAVLGMEMKLNEVVHGARTPFLGARTLTVREGDVKRIKRYFLAMMR